ncbi:hypothetical protein HPB50_027681 [Hyalomma asiaticum]|nr:hypothetical protein HPB50_027681 [Hyalomma asiaticum]
MASPSSLRIVPSSSTLLADFQYLSARPTVLTTCPLQCSPTVDIRTTHGIKRSSFHLRSTQHHSYGYLMPLRKRTDPTPSATKYAMTLLQKPGQRRAGDFGNTTDTTPPARSTAMRPVTCTILPAACPPVPEMSLSLLSNPYDFELDSTARTSCHQQPPSSSRDLDELASEAKRIQADILASRAYRPPPPASQALEPRCAWNGDNFRARPQGNGLLAFSDERSSRGWELSDRALDPYTYARRAACAADGRAATAPSQKKQSSSRVLRKARLLQATTRYERGATTAETTAVARDKARKSKQAETAKQFPVRSGGSGLVKFGKLGDTSVPSLSPHHRNPVIPGGAELRRPLFDRRPCPHTFTAQKPLLPVHIARASSALCPQYARQWNFPQGEEALVCTATFHHWAFSEGQRAVVLAPPGPCRAERVPSPGPAERLIIIVTRHPTLAGDS